MVGSVMVTMAKETGPAMLAKGEVASAMVAWWPSKTGMNQPKPNSWPQSEGTAEGSCSGAGEEGNRQGLPDVDGGETLPGRGCFYH